MIIKKGSKLKNFFCLSPTKVILTLVLLGCVFFFVYGLIIDRFEMIGNSQELVISNPVFWVLSWPSLLIILMITIKDTQIVNSSVSFVVLVVVQIVYSYVLSCAITYALTKLREK